MGFICVCAHHLALTSPLKGRRDEPPDPGEARPPEEDLGWLKMFQVPKVSGRPSGRKTHKGKTRLRSTGVLVMCLWLVSYFNLLPHMERERERERYIYIVYTQELNQNKPFFGYLVLDRMLRWMDTMDSFV